MEIEFSLHEIQTVANAIIAHNPKKIILFYGEMGVGKTTLIKEIAKTLGVKGATSSPTFSLVNEYPIEEEGLLYHFDMYRLKEESEAYDMGMDDYLYSGNWCCIEWPEKIPSLIPEEHSTISIRILPDGKRLLSLK